MFHHVITCFCFFVLSNFIQCDEIVNLYLWIVWQKIQRLLKVFYRFWEFSQFCVTASSISKTFGEIQFFRFPLLKCAWWVLDITTYDRMITFNLGSYHHQAHLQSPLYSSVSLLDICAWNIIYPPAWRVQFHLYQVFLRIKIRFSINMKEKLGWESCNELKIDSKINIRNWTT